MKWSFDIRFIITVQKCKKNVFTINKIIITDKEEILECEYYVKIDCFKFWVKEILESISWNNKYLKYYNKYNFIS